MDDVVVQIDSALLVASSVVFDTPFCGESGWMCIVRQAAVCDGHDDCIDGSDELNCESVTSPSSVHRPSSTTNIHYAIGISIVGSLVVLAFTVLLLICVCRHKSQRHLANDDDGDLRVDKNIVLVTRHSSPTAADASDNYSTLRALN